LLEEPDTDAVQVAVSVVLMGSGVHETVVVVGDVSPVTVMAVDPELPWLLSSPG
jgi:hypothetical protein